MPKQPQRIGLIGLPQQNAAADRSRVRIVARAEQGTRMCHEILIARHVHRSVETVCRRSSAAPIITLGEGKVAAPEFFITFAAAESDCERRIEHLAQTPA